MRVCCGVGDAGERKGESATGKAQATDSGGFTEASSAVLAAINASGLVIFITAHISSKRVLNIVVFAKRGAPGA